LTGDVQTYACAFEQTTSSKQRIAAFTRIEKVTVPDHESQAPASRAMAFANFVGPLVPFLWFVLACIAFLLLFPLAKQVIESGSLNKVRVGLIEFELTHVVKQVFNVEIAQEGRLGEHQPIDPQESKRISDRFASMAEKLRGATILWVDDYHPHQNVAERRVFLAAGMSIDTALTTEEAMQWLARTNYDVLITDADRSKLKDPSEQCYPNAAEPANAGCALLKKVGGCFERVSPDKDCARLLARSNARKPIMIMYSEGYPKEKPPPFASGVTNRAVELFDLVLDALNKR
jgi:hypothetical protein